MKQFDERRDITVRRVLRGILGNYNISDRTLKEIAEVAFDSGVLAGVSKAYELQLSGQDVRECIKDRCGSRHVVGKGY